MKIRFILTGEGSSDRHLVDHIENIFIEEGFSEASGEAPDLGLFHPPVGRSVAEKLRTLVDAYPNADVIFVHRDADGAGIIPRRAEVLSAAEQTLGIRKVIPIIPVCQLETWLLTDQDAIKRVAGNTSFRGAIRAVPPLRNLEEVADSKAVLRAALCEASETQGTRLKKFKDRFGEMRARLTFDLDPSGPVCQLTSYQRFREELRAFSEEVRGIR
jgi:hypothetical protein